MTFPKGTAVLKATAQFSGQTDSHFSWYPAHNLLEHAPCTTSDIIWSANTEAYRMTLCWPGNSWTLYSAWSSCIKETLFHTWTGNLSHHHHNRFWCVPGVSLQENLFLQILKISEYFLIRFFCVWSPHRGMGLGSRTMKRIGKAVRRKFWKFTSMLTLSFQEALGVDLIMHTSRLPCLSPNTTDTMPLSVAQKMDACWANSWKQMFERFCIIWLLQWPCFIP